MPSNFTVRKLSSLPPKAPVQDADQIVIVGDGTPPDGALASIGDLADLAASKVGPGPKGDQGASGPPGPRGDGLRVNGHVSSVADLGNVVNPTEGDLYIVTTPAPGTIHAYNGGGNWAPLESGVGAKGDDGPQGPPGPDGPRGADGPVGPKGDPGSTTAIPVGALVPYAGVIDNTHPVPTDYLVCDGSTFDQGVYPALFNAISYAYGQAGGQPRTPNLKGKVPFGADAGIGILVPPNNSSHRSGGSRDLRVIPHTHAKGNLHIPHHRHGIPTMHGGAWTGYMNTNNVHGHHINHSHPFSSSQVFIQSNTSNPSGTMAHPSYPGATGGVHASGQTGWATERHHSDGTDINHVHQTATATNNDGGGGGVIGDTGGAHGAQSATDANMPPFIAMHYLIRAR